MAGKEQQKEVVLYYKEGRGDFSRDQATECCKQ